MPILSFKPCIVLLWLHYSGTIGCAGDKGYFFLIDVLGIPRHTDQINKITLNTLSIKISQNPSKNSSLKTQTHISMQNKF